MAHELPELPYAKNALEPHISERTLSFHHGKHHAGYVKKLNAAVEGTDVEGMPLDELVKNFNNLTLNNPKAVFNNAAQHWNHSFYWKSMSPNGGGQPEGALADAIQKSFGGLDSLKEKFLAECATHFGSGWGWMVKTMDGGLKVVSTHDADTPYAQGQQPILTCDVWEHAYYLDYQNARPDYLESFWKLVNWEFAAKNFEG